MILRHAAKVAPNEWKGPIFNPENGKLYPSTITLDKPNQLTLKGCLIAFLCQSETWTRDITAAPDKATAPSQDKAAPTAKTTPSPGAKTEPKPAKTAPNTAKTAPSTDKNAPDAANANARPGQEGTGAATNRRTPNRRNNRLPPQSGVASFSLRAENSRSARSSMRLIRQRVGISKKKRKTPASPLSSTGTCQDFEIHIGKTFERQMDFGELRIVTQAAHQRAFEQSEQFLFVFRGLSHRQHCVVGEL